MKDLIRIGNYVDEILDDSSIAGYLVDFGSDVISEFENMPDYQNQYQHKNDFK
jgi:hypothetical protein